MVGVITAMAIGASNLVDHQLAGGRFINNFGLALLVPVATLVFASAALGDPNEDGTLVYLWLRPVPRSKIVVIAAIASSITVTWPIVVAPLLIAAAVTGVGSGPGQRHRDRVHRRDRRATARLFVALGLRVKRALVWGLLYILIWEGFVATANASAARLADPVLHAVAAGPHGRRVPAARRCRRRRGLDRAAAWWRVVAAVYATWRLTRQDVM